MVRYAIGLLLFLVLVFCAVVGMGFIINATLGDLSDVTKYEVAAYFVGSSAIGIAFLGCVFVIIMKIMRRED